MNIFWKQVGLYLLSALLLHSNSMAQNTDYLGKKGQLYFSWGYNKEWYTQSNIHVRQEALGNDYTFKNVIGKDKPCLLYTSRCV